MKSTAKIAQALDLELHEGEVIEVGLTTIDLGARVILQSYSFPIKHDKRISDEIYQLTGWTQAKLNKSGEDLPTVYRRLLGKYGLLGRLLVVDDKNEFLTIQRDAVSKAYRDPKYLGPYLGSAPPEQMNVSNLYRIKYKDFSSQSLLGMLEATGLGFIGRQHRAKDDSFNIARLFMELIK